MTTKYIKYKRVSESFNNSDDLQRYLDTLIGNYDIIYYSENKEIDNSKINIVLLLGRVRGVL